MKTLDYMRFKDFILRWRLFQFVNNYDVENIFCDWITGRYSSNIEYIICFLERMRFQILFIYSIEKMKKNRRNGFLTIYISLFGDRYSW